MEALAQQLHDLADQVRKTEDVVAASGRRDRPLLEARRDQLRESWSAAVSATRQQIDADDVALHFRWSQMRERIKGQFAELQDRSERRRADQDWRNAIRRADRAERDAAEAVDFAVLVVNGATAAVIDAMLARADADGLATSLLAEPRPGVGGESQPL